ncbi:lasso RiPP family leader peptide-containing protein [Streptomyces antimycoticus]
MDTTRYEAPALFEIGGFSDKTRRADGGWHPDLILPYIA